MSLTAELAIHNLEEQHQCPSRTIIRQWVVGRIFVGIFIPKGRGYLGFIPRIGKSSHSSVTFPAVLNAQAPLSICQFFQLMPIPSHANGHSRIQRGRFPEGSTQAHLWIWMDTQVSYQEAKEPRSTDPSKLEKKHSSVLWPGLKHKICKHHTVL